MATAPENKRTDSIRVRLAPEMMERFESLAKMYGMPPATLCAFAVAQFVQKEETNRQMGRMAMLEVSRQVGDQLGDMMKTMADSEEMDEIVSQSAMAMVRQQQALPLDGEAAKGAA